jgi:hypothetical protein
MTMPWWALDHLHHGVLPAKAAMRDTVKETLDS